MNEARKTKRKGRRGEKRYQKLLSLVSALPPSSGTVSLHLPGGTTVGLWGGEGEDDKERRGAWDGEQNERTETTRERVKKE